MRHNSKLLLSGAFALVVMGGAASVANAAFTATLNNWNLGTGNTKVQLYNPSNLLSLTHTDYSNQGGQFNWTQVSPLTPNLLPSANNSFISFCIQMNQVIGTGSQTYNPGLWALNEAPQPYVVGGVTYGEMGTLNSNLMAQLWYNNMTSTYGGVATAANSATYDSLHRGAFQIAVWKLAYERSANPADHLNLAVGNVRASAINNNLGTDAELILAQTWLNNLTTASNGAGATRANLYALSDNNGNVNGNQPQNSYIQDQVVATGGSPLEAVPEPASALAWTAMGLVGFVIQRRNRARRA